MWMRPLAKYCIRHHRGDMLTYKWLPMCMFLATEILHRNTRPALLHLPQNSHIPTMPTCSPASSGLD